MVSYVETCVVRNEMKYNGNTETVAIDECWRIDALAVLTLPLKPSIARIC
jgi:hypothetical protein